MAKRLMIMGTASDVGKSLLVTALCRIFTVDGYQCAPFKAQNMSLNSYSTILGGEMGRAQAVQAEACGRLPELRMNPVLLKPTSDRKSQVILLGKAIGAMDAIEYYTYKPALMQQVQQAFDSLAEENDIVVLEGAGSPAEINLKEKDIVNMNMAKAAKAPVLLVGDIDKGGVFAALYGTIQLLPEEERKRIKGFLINKFRGDPALLESGLTELTRLTGIPVLGVIPMLDVKIEEEDSASFKNSVWWRPQKQAIDTRQLDLAVIALPFLSNFTDIHALELEPYVSVRLVKDADAFGTPDIVIVPGSKSTMAAMAWLQKTGLDAKIKETAERGGFLFGICGGYQILGREILDPEGVEAEMPYSQGLGLLNCKTTFIKEKTTTLSVGRDTLFSSAVTGYEIHMGREEKNCYTDMDRVTPLIEMENGIEDGAVSASQKIIGTYFHGIFDNSQFRRRYLNHCRCNLEKEVYNGPLLDYESFRQGEYDKLEKAVRQALDMKKLYQILEEGLS